MKKPSKTSVIKTNDKLARQLNIIKGRNQCDWCGRSGNIYKLDWSHVFTREIKCIRWDMDNCMLHCFVCHAKWHHQPLLGVAWFNKKYPGRKQRLQAKINQAKTMTVQDYLKVQQTLQDALIRAKDSKGDK